MKNKVRSEVLKLIRTKNKEIASNYVVEAISKSKVLDKFNKIGIYYPIGNEINVLSLTDMYPNKLFYLPKTSDTIEFVEYNSNSILIDGLFKTKEPASDKITPRDDIECFVIPCVGITKYNQRLGYGKGYYDKYLAGYTGLKIGICYDVADNLDLEYDKYDIVIDIKFVGD